MQGIVGLSVNELISAIELRRRIDRDHNGPFEAFGAVDRDDLDRRLRARRSVVRRALSRNDERFVESGAQLNGQHFEHFSGLLMGKYRVRVTKPVYPL